MAYFEDPTAQDESLLLSQDSLEQRLRQRLLEREMLRQQLERRIAPPVQQQAVPPAQGLDPAAVQQLLNKNMPVKVNQQWRSPAGAPASGGAPQTGSEMPDDPALEQIMMEAREKPPVAAPKKVAPKPTASPLAPPRPSPSPTASPSPTPSASPMPASPATPVVATGGPVANASAQPKMSWQDRFKQEVESKVTRDFLNTQQDVLSPSKIAALSGAYKELPEVQALNSELKAYDSGTGEILKGAEGLSPQVDLMPTLAFLDTVSGNNMSGAYKRPTSSLEQMTKMINERQDNSRSARQKLLEQMVDFVKAAKGGSSTERYGNIQSTMQGYVPLDMGRSGAATQAQLSGQLLTLTRMVQADESIKNVSKGSLGAEQLLSAATKGKNWVNDQTIVSSFLKAMDLYPISDMDYLKFSAGPSFKNQWDTLVARLNGPDGDRTLSDRDQQLFLEMARNVKEDSTERLQAMKDSYKIKGIEILAPLGATEAQVDAAVTPTMIGTQRLKLGMDPKMAKPKEPSLPEKEAIVRRLQSQFDNTPESNKAEKARLKSILIRALAELRALKKSEAK